MSQETKKTQEEENKKEKSFEKRLQEARSKIKVPKDRDNKYGGFNYRKAEDILREVNEILPKYDLRMDMNDEIVLIGDRYYIKHTVEVHDMSKNPEAQYFSASGWAREPLNKKGMDEPQITGTASSYAKKRALANMFHIDEEKDPDEMDNTKKKQSTKKIIEQKINSAEDEETLNKIEKWIESKDLKNKQEYLDMVIAKRGELNPDDDIPVIEED